MIDLQLRARLLGLLASSEHLDRRSAEDAISWIRRCETPYRLRKPDVPNTHLAAYAIIRADDTFLLVDHARARSWIPVGGHLEPGELPAEAIAREVREELGVDPKAVSRTPFFVTRTKVTDGQVEHTDVTFWHIVDVERAAVGERTVDGHEKLRWFGIDEIRDLRDIVGLRRAIAAMERSDLRLRCRSAPKLGDPRQGDLNLHVVAE